MARRKLPLPPPRTVPWALKPLQSARSDLSYDRLGRMVMHIEHDVVRGLTPRQVAWWFANIGGHVMLGDTILSRYLVWHPLDHVHWELARPGADGRAGAGARYRIVEAFGRDPAFYIDVVDTVERLDETGITLVGHKLGLEATRLVHDFSAVDGGTRYVSTLTVGTAVPGVAPLVNRLIRRVLFSEAMGRAWIRHNIEEVGVLEHLVPLVERS